MSENTYLMRGANMVRDDISQYLSVAVPRMLVHARAQWNLDEKRLPTPVAYDAYEPTSLDRWPLIGVVVNRTRGWNRVDYDDVAAEHYRPRYFCRVYTWVKTPMTEEGFPLQPDYDQTLKSRDDLGTVVRACLLDSLTLRTDLTQPEKYLLDEGTLIEDYSQASKVGGDRWVAGVVHDFELQVDESLFRLGIGMADTIDNETDLLQ